MNLKRNIIIVGAGISGLVAGYYLQKRGFKVTLLEKSSTVGGRMATVKTDNFIVDSGAQFLSSGYEIISNLINELGFGYKFIKTSPYAGIVKDKKIYKFRYDNPFSLLSVYGFKDWLRLGAGGFKLQKEIKDLPVNDYSAWSEFDNQNSKTWSDNFYSKKITDYFFDPILEAFYFQAPEITSKTLPIALTKFTLNKAKTIRYKI